MLPPLYPFLDSMSLSHLFQTTPPPTYLLTIHILNDDDSFVLPLIVLNDTYVFNLAPTNPN